MNNGAQVLIWTENNICNNGFAKVRARMETSNREKGVTRLNKLWQTEKENVHVHMRLCVFWGVCGGGWGGGGGGGGGFEARH